MGTPTNQNIWTYSVWVKRGLLGASGESGLLHGGALSASHYMEFTSGDALQFIETTGPNAGFTTTQLFRDPSAWYHIVMAVSSSATGTNKIRVYVNGSEVTSFSYDARSSWLSSPINQSGQINYIGLAFSTTYTLDGYLAEINFIDGQQLTPSSFGAIDANGVWSPTAYSGTYGNNGFYLKFADNSGATATTIGKDSSGNGNNWTPNNISVTAGTTYDSMIDSPTNAASATQPVGNYCVLNGLDKYSNVTLSNANLSATFSAYTGFVRATFALPSTGQWYWEGVVPTTDVRAEFGIATFSQALGVDPQTVAGCWIWYSTVATSTKFNNGVPTTWGTAWASGDIIGMAFDAGAGTLTYYKNGTLQGGGAAFTGLTGTYAPMIGFGNVTSTAISINFGQRPFSYSPPSGHQALCTANLATPTIKNGAQYMAATTYTGTGATLSITNTVNSTSFKPDWVWVKGRSASTDNKITDSVRGVTNALITNSTAAQTTDAGGVTAFNSNGFTLGTTAAYNTNTATYVGWQWKCNAGSTSSNTNGSITSTVQVNTTAGFSILTYTGTGANATVGHGLGVTPSMIIVKAYSGATGPHSVWHTKLPIPTTQRFMLQSAAAITGSSVFWNSTLPTSSVFSIGTSTDVNTSTASYLAYCFSAIAGYSAFGSYVGNASAEGPFVYCGFRPRCILIRLTDTGTGENSYLFDTARNTYNTVQNALEPSQNSSETLIGVVNYIDILSNGFKCRSATLVNASGLTYVYAAFAENPFNYSRAR
jgi:hypothetical protein